MNAPTRILASVAPQRWADHRTQQAHKLLEAVLCGLNPEIDAASMVYQAMEAIEAADCELESGNFDAGASHPDERRAI